MWTKIVPLALAALIGGCATNSPIMNPAGMPVKFSNPVLDKAQRYTAKFVLLEKGIADGRYAVVSISANRQAITNPRQERIAFSADQTAFAPDFSDSSFRTYIDSGNYNEATVVTDCGAPMPKSQSYTPCNSEFGSVFIPTTITKAYVAGSKSAESMKEWRDPARNRVRYVESPQYALTQAGVFQRFAEIAAAK